MRAVLRISYREPGTPVIGAKRGRSPRPAAALAVSVCLRPLQSGNALPHHEIQPGEVEQRECNHANYHYTGVPADLFC
jgi:hypothetical protein